MKTFEAIGNIFCISPVLKKLACRGSSNSATVCFKLNRFVGETDLSECNCTVKTRNSEGASDLAVPKLTADDKNLFVNWTLSSASTAVTGPLLAQLQFEKIFDDKSKNVNWQSNIMEFEIPDSLDAEDEIMDQEPTLFQQWEEKVNTLYADAEAKVQSVQALQTQVQTNADAVAQQKQSVEQTAAQAAQSAQEAAGSSQGAADSANAAQASAQQAQTGAAEAQTAQGLANGYSDAAAASAQAAQHQVETAQEITEQAQQKVDAFSGYTKTEIDNGFANALIGEASGPSVEIDDIQANTDFRSLVIAGRTAETGSGDKSPDNPYALTGTAVLTISDGDGQSQAIALPQPLYSIPPHTSISAGEQDMYDIAAGSGVKNIGVFLAQGTENVWSYTSGAKQDGATALFGLILPDRLVNNSNYNGYCSHVPILINTDLWNKDVVGAAFYYNSKVLQVRVPRSIAADLATLKSWLAAQFAAGTPFTVVYPLAAPAALAGSPLNVPAASGTVSADCTTVSVRYNRDINAAFAKMESALQALS